jgi:hypothetical protein
MGSSFFWDFTQRRLMFIDISGQTIGPVFKGQAVQEDCDKDLGQSVKRKGGDCSQQGTRLRKARC